MQVFVENPNTIVIDVDQGRQGRGIQNITYTEVSGQYFLIVTYTDGTTETLGPLVVTGGAVFLLGGNTGSIPYQSAPNTTVFLPIGTQNQVVVAGATAPQYTSALTGLTVNNSAIGNTAPSTGAFTNLSASGTFALTGDQVQISEGGTGQTTANGAFNALAPSQTGNAGKYLKTDGTNASWDQLDISTADITGVLPVANGGTGASTAAGARANLSAAILGTNNDITSMTGVTGGISTPDFVQFDTTATEANAVGKVYWDAAAGTLDLGLLGGNVVSRIGQSLVAYVTNAEAVTITKGQAVYLFSAQGNRASVKLASNLADATSAKTFGVVAENISANGTGFIMCQGVLEGLNLGAYTAGDTLYLGATPGSLTATKPYAPNHLVYVGLVERANAGNGQLYVKVQNGYELDEIHDVQIINPQNGQTILYDASTSLWKNANLTAGTGISVTNGAASVTIGNTGVLSFSGGTTGLTPATSTTGVVTLGGTLAIGSGGTGQTTANASFNALAPSQTGNAGKYLKTDGTNSSWDQLDISTSDITGILPVLNGGTGSSTASGARTNLGAAASAITISAGTGLSGGGDLTANRTLSIANTAVTAASYGSASSVGTFTVNAQGQLTAAASTPIAIANTQVSGLGTMSTQNANSVAITGGSVDGTTIGGTTRAAGSFTTLTLTNALSIANGGTGQTTANAAFNALVPSQTGNAGRFLTTDGTNTSWAANPLGTVTSVDVSGGTTGLTTSGGPITSSGTITLGGTLGVANGGTGTTTAFTAGSVVFAGASGVYSQNNVNFFWDNTNTRLGIGTAAPAAKLSVESGHLNMTTDFGARWRAVSAGAFNGAMLFDSGNNWIVQLGSALTESMRLSSAGNLGIGTSSPNVKLDVRDATSATIQARTTSAGNAALIASTAAGGTGYLQLTNAAGDHFIYGGSGGTQNISFAINGEKMRLDSSGNLGLGVTPSAWFSDRRAMQLGSGASVNGSAATSAFIELGANFFQNASNADVYIASSTASKYRQLSGAHTWFTAPSGTAGNTISFTQAMTLDASGNLGIGTTSPTNILSLGGNSARTIWMERHTTANTAGNNLTLQSGGATSGATDKNGGTLILSSGTATGSGSSLITFLTAIAGAAGTADRAPAERGRFDASGNFLVGTTTNTNTSSIVANGTISETVSSTQYLVASQFDVGTAPNKIPLNQYLGNLAYQNASSIAGRVGLSAGTAALPSMGSATDAASGTWFPAASTIAWSTAGSERMRLDASGNFGIGTSSPTLLFQVGSRGGMTASGVFQWGSALTGNNRGVLSWDTNITIIGAPQNLVFCANSETAERMRITANGNQVATQIGESAQNTSVTLTVANLQTRIITSNAAVTLTLPTGTDLEGYTTSMATNTAFECTFIATTANAITIAANGNTTVGSLTVAGNSSGTFRFRKTATNTFTVYRVA